MSFASLFAGDVNSSGSFWMPKQASTVAANTDALFNYITLLVTIFFILVVGAMVYFVFKYRRKNPGEKTADIKGNHTLEVIWSVIPGILLLTIFAWALKDWFVLGTVPADAMEVRVTGKKWNWEFRHTANGASGPELVVPVGRPVKLTMNSIDVLHSFYVPDFRIKRDVLPGRYTVQWFQANEVGDHFVECAEYCGTSHSNMLTTVRVVSEADYAKWVESSFGAGLSPVELGKKLFTDKGCGGCHSVKSREERILGPGLAKAYGTERPVDDHGAVKTVKVDDDYIRESLLDPAAKVAVGFPAQMPSFKGNLSEKEVAALIEYIKELGK